MSKFYAIKEGHIPGIYSTWIDAEKQVKGYPGAVHKSFKTLFEAQAFLSDQNLPPPPMVAMAGEPFLPPPIKAAALSIYTDGGHNARTGLVAWGRVTDDLGVDIIQYYPNCVKDLEIIKTPWYSYVVVSNFNDCKQQNNGAELLSFLIALRIAVVDLRVTNIKTDSDTVHKYWTKKLKPESRAKMDHRKAAYIDEAIKLRVIVEARGVYLEKISGDHNKADLGFH
jgi:ribonuclease HI